MQADSVSLLMVPVHFTFLHPRKMRYLLFCYKPLGQTSPIHIFLIKDQEKKTRQHLHRQDLKDPTELGLREGSRGCGTEETLLTGRFHTTQSLGCSPHRQGGLRGCTGTFKPDGAHRCEASLLKVGHHGLDNKNL